MRKILLILTLLFIAGVVFASGASEYEHTEVYEVIAFREREPVRYELLYYAILVGEETGDRRIIATELFVVGDRVLITFYTSSIALRGLNEKWMEYKILPREEEVK